MSSKSRQGPKQPPVMQTTSVRHQQVWNYPIPPPDLFDKFKDIDPRINDQFLEEWKTEAAHRRAAELRMLDQRETELRIQEIDVSSAHSYDRMALMLSTFVIIALLAATAAFTFHGMPIAAVTSLIGTLGLFLYRKGAQAKDDKR